MERFRDVEKCAGGNSMRRESDVSVVCEEVGGNVEGL